MKNIIKISIMIVFLIIILSTNIFASSVKEMFDTAESWIQTGNENTDKTMDTSQLKTTSDIIFNIFLGIGIAVAVIVGAILGIQFMISGIDQKVQVKEALLPYVISCIVLFGAAGIWKATVKILSSIETTTSSGVQTSSGTTQTSQSSPGGSGGGGGSSW